MIERDNLYVLKGGDLRKSLVKKCYDIIWVGHLRQERTCTILQCQYYWPQMCDDIATYVKTCLVCRQDKADHQKMAGLLDHLSITTRPHESVSMDYIIGFPKLRILTLSSSWWIVYQGMQISSQWGYLKTSSVIEIPCLLAYFGQQLSKLLGFTLSMSFKFHL